jgi:hypothetical protein
MTEQHPFRFGLNVCAPSREAWVDKVRKTEALGNSSVLVGDHLGMPVA